VVLVVDRYTHALSAINNDYWVRLRLKKGAGNMKGAIRHFAGSDARGLMDKIFCAGLLAGRERNFRSAWLGETSTFEYPLIASVAANPILKPIGELQPPAVRLQQIGNDQEAAKLLRQAGQI
jgi:iron(III) transport system substrate-binding protein